MSLTSGERSAIAVGAVLLAGSLGVSVQSTLRSDIPRSLTATALVFTALFVIGLVLGRAWITDVREQRRDLAQARRDAESEQRRYLTLRAAMEGEMTRLQRDMNAEMARVAKTLVVERKAMRDEFEERRLEDAKAAFQTGVEMERSGMLKRDEPAVPANLIQFPKQTPGAEPQQERSHERSREHGGVAP